jgi:hypothetical protein
MAITLTVMEKYFSMDLRLPENSGLDWFCRLVEDRHGAGAGRFY